MMETGGYKIKDTMQMDILIAGYLITEKSVSHSFTVKQVHDLLSYYRIGKSTDGLKNAIASLIRRGLIENTGDLDQETGARTYVLSNKGFSSLMDFRDVYRSFEYRPFY